MRKLFRKIARRCKPGVLNVPSKPVQTQMPSSVASSFRDSWGLNRWDPVTSPAGGGGRTTRRPLQTSAAWSRSGRRWNGACVTFSTYFKIHSPSARPPCLSLEASGFRRVRGRSGEETRRCRETGINMRGGGFRLWLQDDWWILLSSLIPAIIFKVFFRLKAE